MPVKPSESEDEYFARLEQEIRKRFEEQRAKKTSEEEKLRLKTLHFMKCPKCGTDLVEMEFKGIKIDECFSCRGMWLDKGEYAAISKIETSVLGRLVDIFRKA